MKGRVVETAIGPVTVGVEGGSVVWVGLPGSAGPAWEAGEDPVLAEAERQLRAYFAGRLKGFDLPLAPAGTEFQRAVWTVLCDIPYGETWAYRDVAARIGRPAAVRAVGAANGANPIAIVVPCHRVIGANGTLVGYGGGLPAKTWLLAHERGECPLFAAGR